jgi:hypothetical protein
MSHWVGIWLITMDHHHCIREAQWQIVSFQILQVVCLVGYLYQGIELALHLEGSLMMCEWISHVSLYIALTEFNGGDTSLSRYLQIVPKKQERYFYIIVLSKLTW